MSTEVATFKGKGYRFKIERDGDAADLGRLNLRHRADDQLIAELTSCEEVVGTPTQTDGLAFEFQCNPVAEIPEIKSAVDAIVARFNQRRGFVHAVYDPRWKIADNSQSDYTFTVYIFPLTDEVIRRIEENPAVLKVHIYGKERGVIWVALRAPFDPEEVRPDLEEILRTFVGKKHEPKSNEETDEA